MLNLRKLYIRDWGILTNMTNIDETHPSLKGKYRFVQFGTGQASSMMKIHKSHVQQNTVDKQIVSDCLYSRDLLQGIDEETVREIKRELGLINESSEDD